jgi:predicted nucleic acid-binding protein
MAASPADGSAIFVDTSGFYAFLDGTDPFHLAARDAFQLAVRERRQLVCTNYVLHESQAVIQGRLGWEAVDAFLDRLVPLCEVVWVDGRLHDLGVARCRQAREQRLSLTDCVSIETMRRRGITAAIAADDHFAREGFTIPRP